MKLDSVVQPWIYLKLLMLMGLGLENKIYEKSVFPLVPHTHRWHRLRRRHIFHVFGSHLIASQRSVSHRIHVELIQFSIFYWMHLLVHSFIRSFRLLSHRRTFFQQHSTSWASLTAFLLTTEPSKNECMLNCVLKCLLHFGINIFLVN